MDQQLQQPQIDLKTTTGVKNSEGGSIFLQGVVLRKISRFVAGTDEDALLPVPVFFDPETKKILESTLPKDLREEFKDELL
tara:strand:+ start:897 stop:1139 length:243 start_codon:yes stop_codon:yes gene_type:complete